jgi:hypothetical protein
MILVKHREKFTFTFLLTVSSKGAAAISGESSRSQFIYIYICIISVILNSVWKTNLERILTASNKGGRGD